MNMKSNRIKWNESMNYICSTKYIPKVDKNCNSNKPSMKSHEITIHSEPVLESTPELVLDNTEDLYKQIKGLLVDLPVLICNNQIEIPLEINIQLDNPITEIKTSKSNLILKKCRIIPRSNKLFLEGYIRKYIEYYSNDYTANSFTCSDIRYTLMHIPIKCYVKLKTPISIPIKTIYTNSSEVEIINFSKKTTDIKLIKSNSFKYFNEKFLCELLSAEIYEVNSFLQKESNNSINQEVNIYTNILLSLNLFQKRQVEISILS